MTRPQRVHFENSQPTLFRHPLACPTPDTTTAAKVFESICAEGDCLRLRPQQRVPIPPEGKLVVLRDGMIAIDATPAKGKLQVLDFLVAGDVVSTSTVPLTPGVSLRAITSTSLILLDYPTVDRALPAHDYWTFLIAQCLSQLTRANIHQLMIGRLETEQRVASFLVALALRAARDETRRIAVSLPMSRTDMANYLVINCDTLSRTMTGFLEAGLIERESRHAICVTDLDALMSKSPLSPLLASVFKKETERQDCTSGLYSKRTPVLHSIPENRGVLCPVASLGRP